MNSPKRTHNACSCCLRFEFSHRFLITLHCVLQIKLFAHLHSRSLRWHLSRKTGEVLRSIDRGTTSINSLLSYIVFSIAPTIFDIIIAIVYFVTYFNIWFGVIVFVCLALYIGKRIWALFLLLETLREFFSLVNVSNGWRYYFNKEIMKVLLITLKAYSYRRNRLLTFLYNMKGIVVFALVQYAIKIFAMIL